MRGFCTRCKEYRGDDEAWKIIFRAGVPRCEKCKAYVDILED